MTKVIVAMSGGVDSSVAAALLKKGGFDTTGFFMRLADLPRFKESEVRARKIAKILKIPFYVFNFEKEFKKRIIDHFLEGYKKGITPNPCVVCNKEIKFGLLLEKALSLDADFIATGHYALKREIKNQKPKIKNYLLLRAKDKEKDQSYFLWMLNQEQLKRILFPIGNYRRVEVKKLAKKFKLSLLLNVPKSTEICFVQTTINPVRGQRGLTERQKKQTSNGVNDFLKKYLKEKPGRVICSSPGDEQKVLGEHKGLWFYTIGQRKGLGKLKIKNEKLKIRKEEIPPFYVIGKDIENNRLIVGEEKDLEKKELIAKNVNWISGKKPKLPLKVKAKIRYRHQPALATLTYNLKLKTYNLKFEKTQRAITPGQSVVFYRGEELLGGGIIC